MKEYIIKQNGEYYQVIELDTGEIIEEPITFETNGKPFCVIEIKDEYGNEKTRFDINENITVKATLLADIENEQSIIPLTREFFTDIVKCPDLETRVAVNTINVKFTFNNGTGERTFKLPESGSWYLLSDKFYMVILCFKFNNKIEIVDNIKLKIGE